MPFAPYGCLLNTSTLFIMQGVKKGAHKWQHFLSAAASAKKSCLPLDNDGGAKLAARPLPGHSTTRQHSRLPLGGLHDL